jgi:hypothetical protein
MHKFQPNHCFRQKNRVIFIFVIQKYRRCKQEQLQTAISPLAAKQRYRKLGIK